MGYTLLLAASVALAAIAPDVRAQAPSSAAAKAPSSTGPGSAALSEVVVTAQRREQSAQNVGIAISVLSGQQLALRGVTDINRLQYQTPGLEITPAFGGGQPNFRLRGVGFDDYGSNNASPVGVYVDEVAFPFPIQTQGQVFDIARVEVLRGPQGTLYGRNTTGGAINFISNRPTPDLQAGLDAEYGAYGYGKVEGYVSGPVADGLRLRLAGITEQGGGYEHDRDTGEGLGNLDRYALRGQAAWDATSKLSVLLEASYGHDGSDGQGLYLTQPLTLPNGTVVPADSNHFHTAWGGSTVFQSLTGVATDAKPFRDNDNGGVDLHVAYDLGFAELTDITAYHALDRREYEDWDASSAAYAGVFFHSRASVLSEELRLGSQDQGPFKWLVGVYYSRERLKEAFISDLLDIFTFDTINTYRQHADTIAGFGQVEYQLTPRLNLIAGLRVEHETRDLLGYTTATDPVIGIGVSGVDQSTSYTKPSGKAALEYKLTSTALLYASASRGVKSGGYTAYNTVTPSQLAPFKPETVWAYEGGAKSDLFDRRVRLNGAVFYYDYRDQQVQSAVPTFAGEIGNIVNAPRSRIYGVDLEADFQPTPRFQVSQALSYKRGQFRSYPSANDAITGAFINRDGQDEGFPKLDYNGSASYFWNVAAYRVTAETDYSYRGKTNPVLLGPPYGPYEVASYWLVNANLTLAPTAGRWSIGLYGRNILDKRYDLTRNFFTGDVSGHLISIAAPGAPATWGGRVTYKY